MAIDFKVVEHRPVAGPGLTLAKVEFRPVPGEPVHSNIFHMQLYPTGRRLLVDGLGRLVTESGIIVPPLPDAALGGFPDENPADPYRREDFTRNNDAEMAANIEAYWERKLKAAAEGRPYPRHHRSTLNLQVGASADDGRSADSDDGPDDDFYDNDNVALNIGFGSFKNRHWASWYRFTGVSGLSGATIDAATISLWGEQTDFGTPVTKILADDSAGPVAPTTAADHQGKTRTAAGVDWDDPNLSASAFTESPSIISVIQELADSYDPTEIQILHDNDAGSVGNDLIRAASYDSATSEAPKLDIDFTAVAGAASLLPRYGHPMRHLMGR